MGNSQLHPMDAFATAEQTAARWGVSAELVTGLCRAGRIPGTRRLGRDWIIPAAAKKPADLPLGRPRSVNK
jgi:hypothetical protein